MFQWIIEIIKKVIINILTIVGLGVICYFFILKPLFF